MDFDIITTGAGKGQAQVLVSSPSGKVIAAKIEETIDGFGAKFTPIEAGPHSVQVQMFFRVSEMRDEMSLRIRCWNDALHKWIT